MSCYVWAKWHLSSIKSQSEDNGLYKHMLIHRQGGDPGFDFIVMEKHLKALRRQVSESVWIEMSQVDRSPAKQQRRVEWIQNPQDNGPIQGQGG